MAQDKGVRTIVRRINEHAIGGYHAGLKKDGPAWFAKSGPWRAEHEGSTGRLYHYGTKMLEWQYDTTTFPATITITGTWTGHGSRSDATGVNGALDALGSRMHYYGDAKGGGPRINPSAFRVGSMIGGSLTSVSPAQYNPRGMGMVFPPQYNPRRKRRRR